MRAQKRSTFLRLEPLEDRSLPSGLPWPDPGHLTLSFAPDGTLVDGAPSVLFQDLDSESATADWQREVLRTFQTWAIEANINIAVVPDGGLPFGATGAVQGDSRFGDIRIAARSMSPEHLANAIGFDWSGSTWGGEVVLNSDVDIGLNGRFDLFGVLLHEAGHAFGLPDSDDRHSIMFEQYGGHADLSHQDISLLQSLYGAREADRWDVKRGNDTIKKATVIGQAAARRTLDADLTDSHDVDYYKVVAKGPTLQIQLQTSGISPLVARVTVFDSARREVTSVLASDPLSGDLTITLPNAGARKTYYVKIDSATTPNDVFGIGAYRLIVGPGTTQGQQTEAATGLVLDDPHTNDTRMRATHLPPRAGNPSDARFEYFAQGRIRDTWDVDYYHVKAPPGGHGQTLVAMVWGLEADGLYPRITAFDNHNRPLEDQVLANDRGLFTVEFPELDVTGPIFLRVEDLHWDGGHNVGDYSLAVGFQDRPATELVPVGGAVLDAATTEDYRSLDVHENLFVGFVLAAEGADADGYAGVRMTVYDDQGAIVSSFVAYAGDPSRTGVLYLSAGTYVVRFTGITRNGEELPTLAYELKTRDLSDGIGPQLIDPILDPPGSGGGAPPTEWYRNTPDSYTALNLNDPPSDPWWG